MLNTLFIRGRRMGISTLVSSQKLKLVSTTIRVNLQFMLVWRLRNRMELASLLEAIHAERARLKRRIHELERAAYDVNRRGMPPLEERRAFTHKCPRDGCRGFLSSAWKCTVCEHYICSECNESKGLQRDADHVCDEGKRQTMQLIRADTKKCSGCGEFIQKVDGCDQMWCPRCGTAWSWRTGAKINGNIHNPHFYEYQRRRGGVLGRELADVPCGGMPTQRELFSALRARRGAAITEAVERRTLQLHRLVLHIDDVERGRYNAAPNEPLNRQMRVQFILNEITEDEFKRALQKQEKAQEKKYSISQVLSMFVDTISDLFRQFVVRGNISVLEEAMALVEYSTEAMLRIFGSGEVPEFTWYYLVSFAVMGMLSSQAAANAMVAMGARVAVGLMRV